MRSVHRSVLFAATLGLMGCIVPTPFSTHTDVITPADSTPVLGREVRVRIFDQPITLGWDEASRAYVARDSDPHSPTPRRLRVARLKGDVYLFQADLDSKGNHVLIPIRISAAREATLLACPLEDGVAAEFGLRIEKTQEPEVQLRGERSAIVGLLMRVLPGCSPVFRLDTLVPPATELASAAAPPGAATIEGCQACPEGGCIKGTVTDASGAALPEITVRAEPRPGSAEARTTRTDGAGVFFFRGLPEGSYVVRIQTTGFAPVGSSTLSLKAGFTYLYETAFELSATEPLERVLLKPPVQCPRTARVARPPRRANRDE